MVNGKAVGIGLRSTIGRYTPDPDVKRQPLLIRYVGSAPLEHQFDMNRTDVLHFLAATLLAEARHPRSPDCAPMTGTGTLCVLLRQDREQESTPQFHVWA